MTEKPNSRILVADDHPVVRQGIVKLVTEANALECIGEVDGVEDAVTAWSAKMPDLGVFDLRMADGDAVGAITRIKSFDPNARVLVVSTFDGEEEVFRVCPISSNRETERITLPTSFSTSCSVFVRNSVGLATRRRHRGGLLPHT